MKRMTFWACAALLTSAALLPSCKKEGQNEPSKQADVVKTEFAISLPGQLKTGPNRMPSTTVQKGGYAEFQGINDLTLIPFATQNAKIAEGNKRLGDNIVLGNITKTGEGTLNTLNNTRLFTNVAIPLTTASFLVYGQSAATGEKNSKGSLTPNSLDGETPATIEFQLEQILNGETQAEKIASVTTGEAGEALLNYLNSVANAYDMDPGDEGYDANKKMWKEYTPLMHEGMAAMFATYSTMHALSSFEVARVMTNLYNSLYPLRESLKLAKNIRAAIANATYVDVTGSEGNCIITMKDEDGYRYKNFPADHKLPEGSVRIKYDDVTAKAFVACDADGYTDNGQIPLDLYVYPSSLWYYANSTIKTANTSMAAEYSKPANDTWGKVLDTYTAAGKPAAVNSLTRSVAIVDAIQYAVARLDVMVKASTLTLPDESGETVTFPAAIPVTAVLVGNQRNVDFNFVTKESATKYTLYDNVMTPNVTTPNSMTAGTADFDANTPTNSTLVLQTPATEADADATDANADVQIAVEFTNNSGSDFYGFNHQLIPAGGKFYLVAKLKASNASETGKKVFAQDYTTTAKLTINNLAKAYNTIPDLRTPALEVGMSVDLSWQSGHTYEIPFE